MMLGDDTQTGGADLGPTPGAAARGDDERDDDKEDVAPAAAAERGQRQSAHGQVRGTGAVTRVPDAVW